MSRHVDGSLAGAKKLALFARSAWISRVLGSTRKAACWLALLLLTGSTFADEASDYRTALKRLHARLDELETARLDYRKPQASLPQELENERLQLVGRLLEEDPVWALSKDLQSDIEACIAGRDRNRDKDTLEDLKDLLALTAGATDLAATREEASAIANRLREFKVGRDTAGAREWLNHRAK